MKMKLVVVSLLVLATATVAWVAPWSKNPPPFPRSLAATPPASAEPEPAPAAAPARPDAPAQPQAALLVAISNPGPARSTQATSRWLTLPTNEVSRGLDLALDPQTSYPARRDFWNQLRQAGQLDRAMTELERRAQADPTNALIPASLGQLCLLKAGQITNSIADQGMLGMKADKVFDQALELDPANWEARFWKATAMSYWPSVLNKSRDVMSHFATLVEAQEAETPQPHFAQTYLLLGQEYAKQGYADHAKDIWQRGLLFFPNESGLKEKLAAQAK